MCKQRVRNVTIGNDAKPHNFATATLFSEFVVMLPHLFSIVTAILSSSQTISALLNFCNSFLSTVKVVPSLLSSAKLFSPLPCISQLSPSTVTFAHLTKEQPMLFVRKHLMIADKQWKKHISFAEKMTGIAFALKSYNWHSALFDFF